MPCRAVRVYPKNATPQTQPNPAELNLVRFPIQVKLIPQTLELKNSTLFVTMSSFILVVRSKKKERKKHQHQCRALNPPAEILSHGDLDPNSSIANLERELHQRRIQRQGQEEMRESDGGHGKNGHEIGDAPPPLDRGRDCEDNHDSNGCEREQQRPFELGRESTLARWPRVVRSGKENPGSSRGGGTIK